MNTTHQLPKVTLDHNCLIHIKQNTSIGVHIRSLINRQDYEFHVVNVGASEMCANLEYASNYEAFEKFLNKIDLANHLRLSPMFIWDFSYWDNCIDADDSMVKLSEDIAHILFNEPHQSNSHRVSEKKLRNRLCDIHTMWCHIHYRNNVFLTTDKNFMKVSKKNRLINIGANSILHPYDLL
jgi:hypothetical protein